MEEALNVGRNNEADTARRRAEAFERAVAQARSILERDTQTGDLFANDRQAAPPMAEMWVIVNEYDDLVDGYGDTYNYGCKVGGCTVHFIDYGEDTGPIIGQRSFPIQPGDTLDTIKKNGLIEEWKLYPHCIELFGRGKLKVVETPRRRIVAIAP